jgi:hypothetical protein
MAVDALKTQVDIYNTVFRPLHEEFSKEKIDDSEVESMIPVAKQTLFIIEGFSDIVDDLKFDEKRFRELIDTFIEDYELLQAFIKRLDPLKASHRQLIDISEKILDKLVKAQNDLGLIVVKHAYRD